MKKINFINYGYDDDVTDIVSLGKYLCIENIFTYYGFNYNQKIISIKNYKSVYYYNNVFKRLYFIYKIICMIRKKSDNEFFVIYYFPLCFLIPFLLPSNKSIFLDIRSSIISKHRYIRFIKNHLLKFESFFYKKILIIFIIY